MQRSKRCHILAHCSVTCVTTLTMLQQQNENLISMSIVFVVQSGLMDAENTAWAHLESHSGPSHPPL